MNVLVDLRRTRSISIQVPRHVKCTPILTLIRSRVIAALLSDDLNKVQEMRVIE